MENTVHLQNEEYFAHCKEGQKLLSSGELTGTYILLEGVVSERYRAVVCVDTNETFFVVNKY